MTMRMTAPATPDPVSPPADRLDSWKEIAAYLKRGVRTVQRWEQSDGLPVHRLGSERTGSVFAYKSELDAWWQARARSGNLPTPAPLEAERKSVPVLAIVVGLLVITAAAAAWLWMRRTPSDSPMNRPLPLTFDHGAEIHPSLSPDGRQVAYIGVADGDRGGHLFVKSIGSDQKRQLTKEPGSILRTAWSPDGYTIAFLRITPPSREVRIVLLPATGGSEVFLPTVLNSPGSLKWTPDGQSLIVSHGSPPAVRLLSVQTGLMRQLTFPPAETAGDIFAALSPDLRHLAFARIIMGAPRVFEVDLGPNLTPDPAGPRQVSPGTDWATAPVYTADNHELIYTLGPWAEVATLVRHAREAGAKPRQILAGRDNHLMPVLSANGRRLVVATRRPMYIDMWRKSLTDTAAPPARFISSSASADLNPDYSPDGTRIAFHSTRTGFSEIWTAQADGSDPVQLTRTSAPLTATPRWSPDGNWIAFESNTGGNHDLYVIPAAGGVVRRLTDSPSIDGIPSWSRDGKFLYFASQRTGRYELWKMPAGGSGAPVPLTRDGGFSAKESPDGKTLYFTNRRMGGALFRQRLPDGTPEKIIPAVHDLFFAVGASGNIYYASARNVFSVWNAATGKSTPLFTTAQRPNIGIAVSPDEKFLVFTHGTEEGTDLYWIDDFR